MMITGRMQVILEEMALDINDFLKTLISEPNDDITRASVQDTLEVYINKFPEITDGFAICNESNNSVESINEGKLLVGISFKIEGLNFFSTHEIAPGLEIDHPDIFCNFYVKPPKVADHFTLPLQLDPLPSAVNIEEYEEIPESLFNSLRV